MLAKTTHASLMFLAIAATSTTSAAPREFDALAAVVNGQVITRSEVEEAIKPMRDMIKNNVPPGAEREKQLRAVRKDALDSLIERELVLSEFKKLGGYIRDEIVEEDINKIIQSDDFGGDRDKFLAQLKAQGMTLKRFKDLRRKMLTVEMMRARETGGLQILTPAQIEEAYGKHGDRFREESFVRVRTLMIPKVTADESVTVEGQRKHITEIRKKILEGDDFAQMAKTYSQDSVAEQGGDRGTVGEESIELRRDLKRAAFALDSGQISEVLEDTYSFWILKVENKKLGKKKPLSDPEVRESCEKLAQLDQRKANHERWIARLKKTASIRVFDSKGNVITQKSEPEPGNRFTPRFQPETPPADAVASTGSAEPAEEKKSVIDRLRIFKRD